MTNLPKELEEIRDKFAMNFTHLNMGHTLYCSGFNTCYHEMLKTHVHKDKVEKLVEALEYYDKSFVVAYKALKEYEDR